MSLRPAAGPSRPVDPALASAWPRRGSGALVDARVWPMHGPDPSAAAQEAQGLLWADGAVVLVGTAASVRAEAARRGIPVASAAGRLVLPGFVDAHTHFLHVGVKKLRPALHDAASRHEVLRLLEGWLRDHPGTAPVIGEGWDESGWTDRAWPTRVQLDGVCAAAGQVGRALVARRVCGHIAVANTAAAHLVAAHWPSDTDQGTGVLLEKASLYLNEVLPTSAEELDGALADACRTAHALGVTTVGDYSQAPYRACLLRAAAGGRLGVRVASSIYPQQLEAELKAGFRTGTARDEGGFLRDGGMKVFLDGSFGARTAALRTPYGDAEPGMDTTCGGDAPRSRHGCVGHPHPNGTLNWSDTEVRALFARAGAAGIQLHAHAIGDAAIDQGLEAYAPIVGSGNALRHRFEHYELAHDGQVAATARLGIVASCQPNFVGEWSSAGGMYEKRLGPRYLLANRFATLRRAGVAVAFGSDGMPFGPLVGVVAACGHPVASERLSAREAVWHYTWMAAWSLGWENAVGSLAPGMRADLVLVEGTPEDPSTWSVASTFIDGQLVHRPAA